MSEINNKLKALSTLKTSSGEVKLLFFEIHRKNPREGHFPPPGIYKNSARERHEEL